MKFATINTADGAIRQINEAFTTETLEQFNARLPEGQQAIECGAEVRLEHVYNAETEEFGPFEPPE